MLLMVLFKALHAHMQCENSQFCLRWFNLTSVRDLVVKSPIVSK